VAGPWFAVLSSGDSWQTVDTIWIGDGRAHERVRVELRVDLEATI
jgi:hypothetical protein